MYGVASRTSFALWAKAIVASRVPAATITASNGTAARAVKPRRDGSPGVISIRFLVFIFLVSFLLGFLLVLPHSNVRQERLTIQRRRLGVAQRPEARSHVL